MKHFISTVFFLVIAFGVKGQGTWNFNLSATNVTCKDEDDGLIDLTLVSPGNFSYDYEVYLLPNTGTPITNGIGTLAIGTITIQFGGLEPGVYKIFITRNTTTQTLEKEITVLESADPLLISLISTTNVLCNGGSEGTVTLEATDGTEPYRYGYGLAGDDGPTISGGYIANGGIFESLSVGNYKGWVQDANGCEVFINFDISEPAQITYNLETINSSCSDVGGQINILDINGGNPFPSSSGYPLNYQIEWLNELAESIGEGQSIEGLVAGRYSLVITDENGCPESTQIELYSGFNIDTTLVQDVQCVNDHNGQLLITVEQDSINVGSTYSISLFGTDGQIGGTLNPAVDTVRFTELPADTYTVEVIASGCTKTIEATIEAKNEITLIGKSTTDLTCRNIPSGIITWEISGGAGGYQYSLDTGNSWQTSPTFTGLSAEMEYSLLVIDNNNCETHFTGSGETATLSQPGHEWYLSPLGTSDVSCFEANDGYYEFRYDPAFSQTPAVDPDFQPVWKDANTGDTIAIGGFSKNNLEPGDYLVSVTSESGCEDNLQFTIAEPNPLTIQYQVTDFKCPVAGAVAEIDASTTTGGTEDSNPGSLDFVWKLGTDTVDTDDLLNDITQEGTYHLFVTDANGCQDEATIVLTRPDPIEISVDSVLVACKGDSTGSISLTVTGGTPNNDGTYLYTWTKDNVAFPESTGNLTELKAGTYKVSVTDKNGCTPVERTIEITEPPTTFSISGTVTDVICNGADDGKIDVTITKGPGHEIPAITWRKNGVDFPQGDGKTKLINGDLEPATYEIIAVDEFGCEKSMTFEVTESSKLLINPIITPIQCDGDFNGQIEIDPQGGNLGSNPNFSVTWLFDEDTIPAQTDESVYSGLGEGIIKIIVVDSTGCQEDTVIQLTAPEPLQIEGTIDSVKCSGDETGSISLDITGGTGPYEIIWKETNASGASIDTTRTISDLRAGFYYVSVNDANNCGPITKVYEVTEPSTQYGISLETTDVLCHGENSGTIKLVMDTIGVHPDEYTVVWYKNGSQISSQSEVPIGAIDSLKTLEAGEYAVVVTDKYGCERTASVTLEDPEPITFNAMTTAMTCAGFSNGRIKLDPKGGNGNFVVSWTREGSSFTSTSMEIIGLSAGKYTATMVDKNGSGCSVDTLINLKDPLPITVAPTIDHPNCTAGDDGSITLTVTNGTPPYFFEWWHEGEIMDTTQNLSDLVAGTYELIVTDQFQCEIDTQEYVVSDPPSDFSIEGTVDKVTCHNHTDGIIDITVAVTGEQDMEYTGYWEKDGELLQPNTADLNGVGPGEYELFITNEYGCQRSRSFSIENPEPLEVEFLVQDVSCYLDTDGSVAVQVTGGYGSYQFEWLKNGESFDATGSFANNLGAAFYELSVTDAEGCINTQTVEVEQPEPFLIEVAKKDNTCSTPFDSELDAVVTGGVPPYKLQWFRDGLPYSKTEDLSSIPSGTYYLSATDTNLCVTTSAEFTVSTPEPLGIEVIAFENNLCPDTENGSLSIQGTGGFFPYMYAFDSAAYGERNNFLNLGDKAYLVSVQDSKGCVYDTVITVGNEHELEAEFSLEAAEFAIDFPITLTDESLGDNIVEWFWDFGDTRASEEQHTAVTYTKEGTYVITLTVENEVGCRLSKSDTVEIIKGFNFTIPTAFTPNGDRSNDNFRPVFNNVEALNMKIQDRNGVLVFETNELSGSWDGNFNGVPAPQGPYYFEVTFTARSGKVRQERGKVFLLR